MTRTQQILRLVGDTMLLWIPLGVVVSIILVELFITLRNDPIVFWSLVGVVAWALVGLFCIHKSDGRL